MINYQYRKIFIALIIIEEKKVDIRITLFYCFVRLPQYGKTTKYFDYEIIISVNMLLLLSRTFFY